MILTPDQVAQVCGLLSQAEGTLSTFRDWSMLASNQNVIVGEKAIPFSQDQIDEIWNRYDVLKKQLVSFISQLP